MNIPEKEINEHEIKYNSTTKYILNFKSPNEIIRKYNIKKAF